MSPAALAWAAAAAGVVGLARPAAAANVPTKGCSQTLDTMLNDGNWLFVNDSATRWCRLRLENEFAKCCTVADFARGYSENCGQCSADCMHQPFMDICGKYFGKVCTVKRKPFFKTGAPDIEVLESFCVPSACDNSNDRELLMAWFGTAYRGRRAGWHADYDSAVLDCPSSAVTIIVAVVFALIGIVGMLPLGIFLFKAPRERGRTLISQSEMQSGQSGQEPQDAVEPMESFGKPRDLRRTAHGGDPTGSPSM